MNDVEKEKLVSIILRKIGKKENFKFKTVSADDVREILETCQKEGIEINHKDLKKIGFEKKLNKKRRIHERNKKGTN